MRSNKKKTLYMAIRNHRLSRLIHGTSTIGYGRRTRERKHRKKDKNVGILTILIFSSLVVAGLIGMVIWMQMQMGGTRRGYDNFSSVIFRNTNYRYRMSPHHD